MRTSLIALSLLALSACGEGQVSDTLHADATVDTIKLETAEYFSTSQSRITIGNMKTGVLGTKYQARVAGVVYNCHYFKTTVTCSRA